MIKDKRKILITGGLGFIGLNLADELISKGYSIVLFDNLSPQVHGAIPIFANSGINSTLANVIRGDVQDPNALRSALKEADVVVHLAAETGTGQSMYEIARYTGVNCLGTAVLLDVLANEKHSVKKIILASSRSVYGEGAYTCEKCGIVSPESRDSKDLKMGRWEPLCPICNDKISVIATPESADIKPASIYAMTKFAQEELFKIFSKSKGLPAVIVRLQNVFGEGQSLNNPYTGILSIFSTRIRQGLTVPVFEDGMESRDFIHVSDVARAIRLCIEKQSPDGLIINIGSGRPSSILAVSEMLIKSFKKNISPVVTGQYRIGDIRHCYADISIARHTIGFEPLIDLEDGINRFVSWVKTQPIPQDSLDQANTEMKNRGMMG